MVEGRNLGGGVSEVGDEPSTPCWRSLLRRMECLTVSKAALRSSSSRMLRAPESAEVRRSLTTLTRAVSVL